MSELDSFVFVPLPHRDVVPNGEIVEVEIDVPEGSTCRHLALPSDIASYLYVSITDGDHGFPGSFFETGTIGPESRGGFIGEHRGPTKLRLWFHVRGGPTVRLSGAVCFERSTFLKETGRPVIDDAMRSATAKDARRITDRMHLLSPSEEPRGAVIDGEFVADGSDGTLLCGARMPIPREEAMISASDELSQILWENFPNRCSECVSRDRMRKTRS